MYFFSKMGPRNWSLVGIRCGCFSEVLNALYLLYMQSGVHDLVSPERSVASRRGQQKFYCIWLIIEKLCTWACHTTRYWKWQEKIISVCIL